jgi:hypothetical protein
MKPMTNLLESLSKIERQGMQCRGIHLRENMPIKGTEEKIAEFFDEFLMGNFVEIDGIGDASQSSVAKK